MNLNISVLKSILGSSFFKISSSLISFITVPLLLKGLGTTDYGTWVTLTALIVWLNIFDFGSGYSLKNRVSESIVEKDYSSLQVLLAGTIQFYIASTFIMLLVFIVCLFTVSALKNNILLSLILYIPIISIFPFNVGNFVLQGLKKFNLLNFILFLQSFVWLIIIILFSYDIILLDIYKIALFYGITYIVARSFIFFISLNHLKFKWKQLLNISNFKASKKSLLVGGRFFLLQISSLILFSIGNIMTYSNLGVDNVAQFDTINKLFLVGMTFFNLIISVFWSEISHAKALKDKVKLFKIKNQLLLISLLFSVGTCVVSYFMPAIIPYWTKGVINVELLQLLPFVVLVIIQYFSYSGAVILNAFEDLNMQVILSIVSALLIIPIAKYFFNINFGIGSMPLASSLVILPTLVYVLYKSNKCINSVS